MELLAREHVHLKMLTKSQIEEIQEKANNWHGCQLVYQTKIFVIIQKDDRLYLNSEQLLAKYPYLSKFEDFHQLFTSVSASVYLVDHETLRWLKKKNKSYLFKQRMI